MQISTSHFDKLPEANSITSHETTIFLGFSWGFPTISQPLRRPTEVEPLTKLISHALSAQCFMPSKTSAPDVRVGDRGEEGENMWPALRKSHRQLSLFINTIWLGFMVVIATVRWIFRNRLIFRNRWMGGIYHIYYIRPICSGLWKGISPQNIALYWWFNLW